MVIAFARAYALRLAVLGAVTAYFLASTPQLISTSAPSASSRVLDSSAWSLSVSASR